jgi:hypothetical protein
MEAAMAHRLYVSYSPTMKPMPFILPELNDALLKAKVARELGFQLNYLELDDGRRLGSKQIMKLIRERRNALAGRPTALLRV